MDGIGLHLVPAQARTQLTIERHGQAIGRPVLQVRGQRGPQVVRPMRHRETQLFARMCQALTSGNPPEAEDRSGAYAVRANGAYLQRSFSRCGPARACLAGIELRVFGNSATPSGTQKCGYAC
jgi:hypothetical protein